MIKLFTVFFFLLLAAFKYSQVIVTPATGGTDLNQFSPNLVDGWAILGNIVITETTIDDFRSTQRGKSLIFSAPENWAFKPNNGTISTNLLTDITDIEIRVSDATFTVLFSTGNGSNGRRRIDVVTISGLQVQPIDPSIIPSTGEILRTSGTGTVDGLTNNPSLSFGTLSLDLDNPLPVELASFSASVKGNSVNLFWKTETEVNNYGFEVERQTSPKSPPSEGGEYEVRGGWEKIGFVDGNGNSNSPKTYSFTDNDVLSGKYYYRLKQIDNDGKYEYSDIVELTTGLPTRFELSQNYPNPFNPTTKIRYSVPPQSPPLQGGEAKQGWLVTLKVYDVLGNEVATLVNEEKSAGTYEAEFSTGSVGNASGIYFYKLQAGSFSQTKKMILMK